MKRERKITCFRDAANDYGVYLFCFAGVLTTQMVPNLLSQFVMSKPIDIVIPTPGQVLASVVVAVIVMAAGERTQDIKGRRTKFGRRAKSAFLLGVSCISLLERTIEGLQG